VAEPKSTKKRRPVLGLPRHSQNGTVNLSGRVTRMQASGSGHWGFIANPYYRFRPRPEIFGSSKLCALRQ
jgi:hypothetical protein